MGIEFWAIVSLGARLFGTVKANYELIKKTWEYLQMLPEWLNYLQQLDEKTATLDRRMEVLSSLEQDINVILTSEELRCGRKRRREVEIWLGHVKKKKSDVRDTKRDITEKKYLFRPWLESRIDRNLAEAQDLYEKGQFSEGLFLDVPSTSKQPLLTQELFGHQGYVDTIMAWLSEPTVSRIGVYGAKGVGKTTILTHIQSRLSQSTSTSFEHVYWISIPEKSSVHTLQNAIAKQVGLNLSDEEDKMIRAAKLHGAITRRGKCVIILDGVGKPFIEEVGIPKEANGCKLVLSTVSHRHCKRMDCDKDVEIKPLSHDDAVKLFRQKLSIKKTFELGPEIEEIVELIVKECQGLPRWLVNVSERLRGVDDINEWRDSLTEVTQFRKGIAD